MKYNKKKERTPTTVTHEGGQGYKQSDEIALLSLLAIGLDKTFYKGSDERETRLVDLISKVAAKDPYFAAQCIVYTRVKHGQRTVTHRAAVEMARVISSLHPEWGKRFFGRWDKKEQKGGIIFRADDITEIAACFFHINKDRNLTNAMKKGFAQALSTLDRFELARYAGKNRGVGLVDIFNMVHPVGKSSDIYELLHGGIKQFGTSEAKNSEAGQEVKAMVSSGEVTKEKGEEILQEKKASNFNELITGKNIGYIQLLRNLKNVYNATNGFADNKELMDTVRKQLTNADKIKASLVFPHQIDLALEFLLQEISGPGARRITEILNEAYEVSVANVKELGMDEHTAVLIDTSGSMHSSRFCSPMLNKTTRTNKSCIEKAALIGATLGKGLLCDVYQFASETKELRFNPTDSINSIKNDFIRHEGEVGHWTQLDTAFHLFNSTGRFYKRIFLVTDGQIADSLVSRSSSYKEYARRVGEPYIYAIDLAGYGTMPLKTGNRFFNLNGYSAQIYETAKSYEVNPQALINEVKQIRI